MEVGRKSFRIIPQNVAVLSANFPVPYAKAPDTFRKNPRYTTGYFRIFAFIFHTENKIEDMLGGKKLKQSKK